MKKYNCPICSEEMELINYDYKINPIEIEVCSSVLEIKQIYKDQVFYKCKNDKCKMILLVPERK
jgi:C4-type Zn-finger protein